MCRFLSDFGQTRRLPGQQAALQLTAEPVVTYAVHAGTDWEADKKAEIKFAQQNLKIEKAIQKGTTNEKIAKMELKQKQLEINVEKANSEISKFEREIKQYQTKDN